MGSNQKQKMEHHYFDIFNRIYTLPLGNIEYYRDKPDIMIHGERKLGIEIRNFYIEEGGLTQSEQKQRDMRKHAIRKAHQKYLKKGGKHEINFSFNKNYPIRDIRKLVDKIVEVILTIEVNESGGIRISNYFSDIPEIVFIYINQNECSDPQWRNDQSHIGLQIMSTDKLEQILRVKEKKVEEYEKCDIYWLLFVIDSFDRAQEQLMPDEVLNGEVKLASDIYEKIILFLNQEQQILHLKG